jgi:hypothetical protein
MKVIENVHHSNVRLLIVGRRTRDVYGHWCLFHVRGPYLGSPDWRLSPPVPFLRSAVRHKVWYLWTVLKRALTR